MKKTAGRLHPVATSRDVFLDFLKGLAIFLVVLEHALHLTFTYSTDGLTGIPRAILLFHMPLFMALSGFFFSHSLARHTAGELFRQKFRHLGLPTIFWGLLAFTTYASFILLSKGIKLCDTLGASFFWYLLCFLWFLPTLLILSLLGIVFAKFLKPQGQLLCWIACGLIIYLIPLPSHLIVNGLRVLLPFFLLGMLCHNLKWSKLPFWIALPASVLFILCFSHFDFSCTLYQMPTNVCNLSELKTACLRFFGGGSGILLSNLFIRVLSALFGETKLKFLSVMGQHTLPIYAIHLFLLYIFTKPLTRLLGPLHLHPIFCFLCTPLLILLSLTLTRLIHRSPILSLFCFGEKRKN